MAKKTNKKETTSSQTRLNKKNTPNVVAEVKDNTFIFNSNLTVGDLSKRINVPSNDIIMYFFKKKQMLGLNAMLNEEQIAEICLEFGLDFKKEEVKDLTNFEQLVVNSDDDKPFLVNRSPIVTIMGHVDHGKTTLIDKIRNSSLASKEAGEITQTIGAYQKQVGDQKITFIDTPGHYAFKAMRSRGASVTDIIILVVAADDGIMPQTKEAIHLAKVSNIPVIVAINKMDKEGANPEKIKTDLSSHGLLCEEWGGDVIVKEISAKNGKGINDLLETIILVSEMQELKANPNKLAVGTVIEARLDKKVGPVATLLVQNGTLKTGDNIVVGSAYAKIRRMTNEYNTAVNQAGPGTPVVITGLSEVPSAGDHFITYLSDKEAKMASDIIKEKIGNKNANELNLSNVNVDEGNVFVLIKADTQGAAEAIENSIKEINVEGVNLIVTRAQTGEVNENDVQLAINTDSFIVMFNVGINQIASSLAKDKDIRMKNYNIIYNIIDDVTAMMKKELKPVFEEVTYGRAEVLQLFKASKIGQIAGCMVSEGKIKRNSKCRIFRKKKILVEDAIEGLKRFKDDAKEVAQGFECGITIKDFQKLEVGDIIESYGMEEVKVGE